jgi:NADPH:quinone reductase-like Zn-dependent oxidoreductase
MKALTVSDYNMPLKFVEIAKPVVGNRELLVQVKDTTVNHVDIVKASGAGNLGVNKNNQSGKRQSSKHGKLVIQVS